MFFCVITHVCKPKNGAAAVSAAAVAAAAADVDTMHFLVSICGDG